MRKEGWRLALLIVALIAAMAAGGRLEQPPSLRPHSKAGEFDALRAKARLAFILSDQRPHPADTVGDDRVRSRIVAELQGMGLKSILRDQFACNELYKQRGVSCARVRNIIVMLGPATGKSMLVNAHYDSTPVGPGAADDGIGVATLLEVAENLKDRPLKRPVFLLFNEGEELGLVGARAFLADPLSRNVDSLINLEARGVQGPANMFETSRPNAAPISVFAAAVKNPVANSLSTDVYRLLPNYTDVNSFAERGWLTFNLAPIGNETRYHSPGDDLGALNPATLQHMGDQTLALTLSLANGAPRPSVGDRIFMDMAGSALISLPLIAGAILMAVLLIAFLILAIKRGGYLRGGTTVITTLIGSAALAWLALTFMGLVRHGMFWRAQPIVTHLATYASAIVVAAALLATIGRSVDVRQLRATYYLLLLAIGALIGLVAPGGIIFFIFPPLLVIVGIALGGRWKPAETIGSIAAFLLLYLTWGGMLGLLEELLNGGPMWIFAPLGSLFLLPVLIEAKPLIDGSGPRLAVLIAGTLTILIWGAALAAPAYSADREQRFVIQHVADASTSKSWWSVLNDAAPLPPGFGRDWKRGELPFSERPRWISPASFDPAAKAPAARLLAQTTNANERTLTIELVANNNEHVELIAPADARIRTAGVSDFVRPIDQNEEGKTFIDCFGRSCDDAILQLTISQLKPVQFVVLGSKAQLPPSAASLLAARPRFARPQYNRHESIVFARVNL